MSGLPPPDDEGAQSLARWSLRLAEVLADVGHRLGQLGEQVPHDWSDARGREWGDRAHEVRTALGREAAAATDLAAAAARQAGEQALPPLVAPGAGRRPGARLGGTEASRADDERGMRIAELADDAGSPPG